MAVTVDLKGVPEFQARLRKAVDQGLARAALIYENANRSIMQTTPPLPGVAQGVAGRNVPSRPGEPPAVQTGQLRVSQTSEKAAEPLTWHVGTSSRVGHWMEFGTTRIAPRPWLSVNLYSVANRRNALTAFSKTVELAVKAGLAGRSG